MKLYLSAWDTSAWLGFSQFRVVAILLSKYPRFSGTIVELGRDVDATRLSVGHNVAVSVFRDVVSVP